MIRKEGDFKATKVSVVGISEEYQYQGSKKYRCVQDRQCHKNSTTAIKCKQSKSSKGK